MDALPKELGEDQLAWTSAQFMQPKVFLLVSRGGMTLGNEPCKSLRGNNAYNKLHTLGFAVLGF